MGTANFYVENATDMYVIEDRPLEDYIYLYQVILDEIAKLEEKYQHVHLDVYPEDKDNHRGINWTDHIFGTVYTLHEFSEEYFAECFIHLIYRPGYYSDGNLDWKIEVNVVDGTGFTESDYMETWEWFEDENGNVIEGTENFFDNVHKTMEQIITDIEAVFSQYSDVTLQEFARFSNGETLYIEKEG